MSARLGLIAAIPQEIAQLGEHFQTTAETTIAGARFCEGHLDGIPIVAVECGIGKVNAAMVTTLLLGAFACDALVFSGVAGGLDPALEIGDAVLATELVQYDYGAIVGERLVTYQPGVAPLQPGSTRDHGYALDRALLDRLEDALKATALPAMSAAATGTAARTPRLVFGAILTGDQFLNCEATRRRLFAEFGALAIEMEGAAIAQVAERFSAPCVVIRAVSDLAGADGHQDFRVFLKDAAAVAARIVRTVAPVLATEVS